MSVRVKLGLACLAAAAATAVAAAKPPADFEVTADLLANSAKDKAKSTIADIVREDREDSGVLGEPYDAWRHAAAAQLAKSPPPAAADALAGPFGLPAPAMRRLVALWVGAHEDDARFDAKPEQRAAAEKAWLALLKDTGRSPLVLEAAAATLGDERCTTQFHDALLAGTADRTADSWRIVRAVPGCAAFVARFSAEAPGHEIAALLVAAQRDWLPPEEKLSLLAYLRDPARLAHIDAASREEVRRYLTHLTLAALLNAELHARTIAAFEAETPEARAWLIKGPSARIRGTVDGIPFALDDYSISRASENETVREGLTTAYALAGRTAEAEALFAQLPEREAVLRRFHCAYDPVPARPGAACDVDRNAGSTIPLLDHLLHHPTEDAYPLAEVFYGGEMLGHHDAGALTCRIFKEPGLASLCSADDDGDRDAYLDDQGKANRAAARAIVAAVKSPEIEAGRQEIAAALIPAPEDGSAPPRPKWRSRASQPAVEPLPPPFEVRQIPPGLVGTAPPQALPKNAAPLPEGFEPVRIAVEGPRIAVISVSQNLDPTGEVSRGGYWIHLSSDGGHSWGTPLYTGLAEAFPFVVLPAPRLSLFDGDTLNLAVDRRQLDTRSITYPPVGLRTLRIEKNLVVRIPLADLQRDSDGDGLSDIAARHLLLAPGAAGEQTAFVVGRQAPADCAADATDARPAMEAVLKQLFSVGTRALVEPMDADRSKLIFGGWRRGSNSSERPIFIEGAPKDYACLSPDRLMIVYTPADLERLRRMSPDFHAARLDKIVFNRTRHRGYLVWSTGWSGGTYRLRRTANGWKLDPISSWIT